MVLNNRWASGMGVQLVINTNQVMGDRFYIAHKLSPNSPTNKPLFMIRKNVITSPLHFPHPQSPVPLMSPRSRQSRASIGQQYQNRVRQYESEINSLRNQSNNLRYTVQNQQKLNQELESKNLALRRHMSQQQYNIQSLSNTYQLNLHQQRQDYQTQSANLIRENQALTTTSTQLPRLQDRIHKYQTIIDILTQQLETAETSLLQLEKERAQFVAYIRSQNP